MATRATGTAALVRVPWNDPVLIKPVLERGVASLYWRSTRVCVR
jgi:2-keto-3-deoxy-L-rhamnonate aldolase RhmA